LQTLFSDEYNMNGLLLGDSLTVASFMINGEVMEWASAGCSSIQFSLRSYKPLNLFKTIAKIVGRFICLMRRACERLYAPSCPGYLDARESFITCVQVFESRVCS
jgi:hypothetical protein